VFEYRVDTPAFQLREEEPPEEPPDIRDEVTPLIVTGVSPLTKP